MDKVKTSCLKSQNHSLLRKVLRERIFVIMAQEKSKGSAEQDREKRGKSESRDGSLYRSLEARDRCTWKPYSHVELRFPKTVTPKTLNTIRAAIQLVQPSSDLQGPWTLGRPARNEASTTFATSPVRHHSATIPTYAHLVSPSVLSVS